MPKWVNKWTEPSDSGNGNYVVSVSVDGVWGCSCPSWKFKRRECDHIQRVKEKIDWKEGDIANLIQLTATRIENLRKLGKTEKQIEKDLAEDCEKLA